EPLPELTEQIAPRVWFGFIRERLIEAVRSAAQETFVNAFPKLRHEKGHKCGAAVVDIPQLNAVGAAGEPRFILTRPLHQCVRSPRAIRLRCVIDGVVLLEPLNEPLRARV